MKFKPLLLAVFFVSCSINHAQSAQEFSVKSSDISPNSKISDNHVFDGFGCSGKNIFPQIAWDNAPKETKSFAVTVYDPDAPTGSGWWHYLAVNIPTNYQSLPSGFGAENNFEIENGINQIRNDYGMFKFGGPCPPQGNKPHRYVFTVFALDVEKIEVTTLSTAALAGFFLNHHSIAKASLTAKYSR